MVPNVSAWLFLGWIIILAVTVPFTKVEESFNMQATHDLITFGLEVEKYDHLEFPGVVPRTFWGALLVACVSKPLMLLMKYVRLGTPQVAVRIAMGSLLWVSHCHFAAGVSTKFGRRVSSLLSLLMILQFHIPFYMSRTLPNTFALAACNVGFAFWLRERHMSGLMVIAVAMVIFRCDLLVLLAPLSLQFLFSGKVRFWSALYKGIATCICALVASVVLDSFFWRHLLWPEGSVLFFNTALNGSKAWGVMPWHWYFTSALPRALHVSLPLIMAGLLGFMRPNLGAPTKDNGKDEDRDGFTLIRETGVCLFSRGIDWELIQFVGPACIFVMLYSLLPHKELRFVFPALPLFTLAAAVGFDRLLFSSSDAIISDCSANLGESKEKRAPPARVRSARWVIAMVLNFSLLLLLAIGISANGLFWVSALHNYPGGHALQSLVDSSLSQTCIAKKIKVHIGVDAAMTGVTRFGHQSRIPASASSHSDQCFDGEISYSKQEGLNANDLRHFDWLLASPQEIHRLPGLLDSFRVVDTIQAFKRLARKSKMGALNASTLPIPLLPFTIFFEPAVHVLARINS